MRAFDADTGSPDLRHRWVSRGCETGVVEASGRAYASTTQELSRFCEMNHNFTQMTPDGICPTKRSARLDTLAWSIPPVPRRILFSYENPAEAERQLRVLLGDTRRLERLGRACREQAAGLTWDSRAAKIDTFVDECLARDPAAVEKGPWSASTCARDSIKWLATGISTGKRIHR